MLWTLWCLWFVVLSCSIFGAWSAVRSSPRQAIPVLLIALLALALRVGVSRDHFYGLEYEDAYVYAAAARQAAWVDPGSGIDRLSICAVGSLEDCSESEVFPGHLPGFPALLRAVQLAVGYRVALAPAVGALISTVAVMAVWWAAWAIYQCRFAAAAAALLFAVTPVFALYGGSALSESVSSLPIAVAIGAAATIRRSTRVSAWWLWHGVVVCAALLATAVRRENLILIGVLPGCLLIRPAGPRMSLRWFVALVWLAVAALTVRLVFPSAVLEVGEYGEVSFGVGRLLEMVPIMLRALATPQWFGITAVLAVIGAATIWGDKERDQDVGLLFAVAAAAVGMVILYGSHVRSTYQLMGVPVEPFDFLRYLSNLGVFLCLLASAVACLAKSYVSRSKGRYAAAFAIAASYIALSAWASWTFRREMVRTEQQVRTEPALAAVEAAAASGNRLPIVTLEPLVVQLLGSPKTKVIALEFLNQERVRTLGGQVLWVRQDHYENEVNYKRYAEFFSALPANDVVELRKGSGWAVLRMGTPQTVRELR